MDAGGDGRRRRAPWVIYLGGRDGFFDIFERGQQNPYGDGVNPNPSRPNTSRNVNSQALLAMAAGLLKNSGPSLTPRSTGQAFGEGLQNFVQAREMGMSNQMKMESALERIRGIRSKRGARAQVAGHLKGGGSLMDPGIQGAALEAYPSAALSLFASAGAPEVKKIYGEDGREQYVQWDSAAGKYMPLGGPKMPGTEGADPAKLKMAAAYQKHLGLSWEAALAKANQSPHKGPVGLYQDTLNTLLKAYTPQEEAKLTALQMTQDIFPTWTLPGMRATSPEGGGGGGLMEPGIAGSTGEAATGQTTAKPEFSMRGLLDAMTMRKPFGIGGGPNQPKASQANTVTIQGKAYEVVTEHPDGTVTVRDPQTGQSFRAGR